MPLYWIGNWGGQEKALYRTLTIRSENWPRVLAGSLWNLSASTLRPASPWKAPSQWPSSVEILRQVQSWEIGGSPDSGHLTRELILSRIFPLNLPSFPLSFKDLLASSWLPSSFTGICFNQILSHFILPWQLLLGGFIVTQQERFG